MRRGLGVWTCLSCGKSFKNDGDYPVCFCGNDDVLAFYAEYNPERIHGDKYEPYPGNTVWEKQANASLKANANENFRRKH